MKSQLIGFKNTTFQESNDLVSKAIIDHFESGRKLIDLVANSCFCCAKKLMANNKCLSPSDTLDIYFDAISYLLGQKYDPEKGRDNFAGSLDNKMQKLFIDRMRKLNKIDSREGNEIGETELNRIYSGSNLSEEEQYLERKKIEDFEASIDTNQIDLDLGV